MRDSAPHGISETRWRAVGLLGARLLSLWCRTLRIEYRGREHLDAVHASGQYIAALWHARILVPVYAHRRTGAVVLVSQSKDGEIIARVLERLGYQTVRGSTTRGGLRSLAALIRQVKLENRPSVFTPDGPQGPRFRVQAGVITAARKTGYPILPLSCSADRMKVFSSWDRFILPCPFTTCRIAYGDLIHVPKTAGPAQEEALRRRLEEALQTLTRTLDGEYRHRID